MANAAVYFIRSSYSSILHNPDMVQAGVYSIVSQSMVYFTKSAYRNYTLASCVFCCIYREQAMETLGIILTFVGSIVASVVAAIVAIKTLNKQEETKNETRKAESILAHNKLESEEDIRQSDAAQRLSISAANIVEKYEVQVSRFEREINSLKLEMKEMKEERDQRYEDMLLELTITQLQLKNAMGVISKWVEYATEHGLPIVAVPATREEIEASIKK